MKRGNVTVIDGESCMFVGSERTHLAFFPEKIIKVYNSVTGVTYAEGADYHFNRLDRTITRLRGSRIPFLKKEEMYPVENVKYYPDPEANAVPGGLDGQNIRFDAKLFFARHQIEVDYQAIPDLPQIPKYTLSKKIRRMTSTGDSITEGYNASAFIGEAPFRKPYAGLVADALGAQLTNLGKNGASVRLLREITGKIMDSNPDLLTIAFGMNDLKSLSQKEYVQEIKHAVQQIQTALPDCVIVLVSPMSGNPEWSCTPPAETAAFAAALQQYAVKENLIFADVFQVWDIMLKRKDFFSLTGNGVNHPNDFGHRLYADTILSALGIR